MIDGVVVEAAMDEAPTVTVMGRQEIKAAMALPNRGAMRVDVGMGATWRDAVPR